MKKILISLSLAAGFSVASFAQVPTDSYLTGSIVTPNGALAGTTNVVLITTNRANVHSIQLLSTAAGSASFYDSEQTNAPFFGIAFTNDTYWTRASYPTNLVTTNISLLTGTTNIFTNVGTFTYFVTNSANTNLLPAAFAAAFSANLVAGQSSGLNLTFARGITMRTTTNVSWVIGYTP